MIYLKNKELTAADNSAQIFNILSTLPSSLTDVDTLLKVQYVAYISISHVIQKYLNLVVFIRHRVIFNHLFNHRQWTTVRPQMQ